MLLGVGDTVLHAFHHLPLEIRLPERHKNADLVVLPGHVEGAA